MYNMKQCRVYMILMFLLSWVQTYAALHEIDNSGKCFTTTKSYISVVVNDTWDGEIIYKNNWIFLEIRALRNFVQDLYVSVLRSLPTQRLTTIVIIILVWNEPALNSSKIIYSAIILYYILFLCPNVTLVLPKVLLLIPKADG